MSDLLDLNNLALSLRTGLENASAEFLIWLPRVLLAVVVVFVGWLVAWLLSAIATRLLHRVGTERLLGSRRLKDAVREAGIQAPLSTLVARILFWGVLLSAALLALQMLGITAVGRALERMASFLPNVFAAIIIMVAGIPVAKLVRSLVASAMSAAGLPHSRKLGDASLAAMVVLVVVLALGQLGVQTDLLVTVVTALVATVGLSLGIAFALGARPLVTNILAGHFLRQTLMRGRTIEVLGRKGELREVGAIHTAMVSPDREWLVPNETMLREVVER